MLSATKDVNRLRVTLSAILLALLIPTAFMVIQGLRQLEREAYFRIRGEAEEVVRRADQQLARWVDQEELRSFADYGFLVVSGDNFVQPSPLAQFPVSGGVAGLVSYFQLDSGGTFSTPLVPGAGVDPNSYGIGNPELTERRALQEKVRDLLSKPRRERGAKLDLDALTSTDAATGAEVGLVTTAPATTDVFASTGALASAEESAPERERYASAPAEAKEASFADTASGAGEPTLERLDESAQSKLTSSLGRVEDLRLEAPYELKAEKDGASEQARRQADDLPTAANEPTYRARQKRVEQNLAPVQTQLAREVQPSPVVRIEQFSSEVEPFRFALLDDDHFALYRSAWRDETRFTQGLVIERDALVQSGIAGAFLGSRLANDVDLTVAFQGELLWTSRDAPPNVSPILLYRDRLAAPFADVELILSASSIPVDAGNAIVTWAGIALVALLVGGFALVYRLGLQQINLNRQQQDFVSAVSHELKTPLTSIRMYGEILQAGWASEEKKRTYYDFISAESERLSRLISNVLQLARLTRNDSQLDLEPLSVAELMDLVRSKIATQLEQAGFQLHEDHQANDARLLVDTDAITQVMINLVDNAIKFSAESAVQRIDLSSRAHGETVELRVRDYGPGIPKDQLKKIFKLFYRAERELTRETVGTGIGLALVNELVTSMGGSIDVQNTDPGVEFRLSFRAIT